MKCTHTHTHTLHTEARLILWTGGSQELHNVLRFTAELSAQRKNNSQISIKFLNGLGNNKFFTFGTRSHENEIHARRRRSVIHKSHHPSRITKY